MASVTTSSEKAIHPGSGPMTSLTLTMVRVGLTRPSMNPSWMPSSADRGRPEGEGLAVPDRRHAPQARRPGR